MAHAPENSNRASPLDVVALALDTEIFTLFPGRRFMARPMFACEFSDINVGVRDVAGRAIKPNSVIVDRSSATGRYLRYAFHAVDVAKLPATDRECLAFLRTIGAAL
jgi:hypothetical protein